jgi:hypothetical protein
MDVGLFTKIDGRTKEARFRKKLRGELTAHVGDKPTIMQASLIDLVIDTALQIERLKAQNFASNGPKQGDHKTFLATVNAMRRHLVALGLEKPETPDTSFSLHRYLEMKDDSDE